MAISSSLCQGVDNFFDSSTKVLVSLGFVIIVLIAQSCTIGIASWSRSETSKLGLWSLCSDNDVLTCCDSVSDSFESIPGWLSGTQTLQCLSLVSLVITVALLTVYTCITKCLHNRRVYIAIMVLCISSGRCNTCSVIRSIYFTIAFFTFVSLITFGDNFRESDLLSDHHLHDCFFVAIAVFCSLVATLIILIIECCSSPSSVSPVEILPVDPSTLSFEPVPVPAPIPPQPPGTVNECLICLDAPKAGTFVPCGHMACCERCANIITTRGDRCPMCRGRIQMFQRVYNS